MTDDWFVKAASVGEAVQLADRGDPIFLEGFPEEIYHARPELSQSALKVILQSPLHFQHALRNRQHKREWDEGHAIHARVVGVGQPIVEIPQKLLSADNGIRSNAAKEWVQKETDAGKLPLKPEQFRRINGAAESVLRHPKARGLFELAGHPEISMFGSDPATGLRLRGRGDWVCEVESGPYAGWTIVDLKGTEARGGSALDIRKLQRTVDDFGYDMQAEEYRLLFELRTGIVAQPTVLIFTERQPPYDVRVVRLDGDWIDGGWRKLRQALDTYQRCLDADVWPGMDAEPGEIETLPTTAWYRSQLAGEEFNLEG